MIAKEWHDARWKVLVASVPVVLLVFLLSPYQEFVEEAKRIPGGDPVENALRDLSDLYYLGGLVVLMPLAGFLGVASVSGEANNGTLLQLLSRPVSRTRLLLARYSVAAGTLLAVAVLGKSLRELCWPLRCWARSSSSVLPRYADIPLDSYDSWKPCSRYSCFGSGCSSC